MFTFFMMQFARNVELDKWFPAIIIETIAELIVVIYAVASTAH